MHSFKFECSPTGRRIRTNEVNEGVKCLAVNRAETLLAMGMTGDSRPLIMDIET